MASDTETTSPSYAAERIIRRMIAEGVFAPGEKVSDFRLSRELGVSRSHVRTALQRLAKERLLTAVPNRGTHVSVIEGQELAELLQLREILEVGAARLAATRASRAQTHLLEESLVVERLALNAAPEGRRLELSFHAELASLAGNSLLGARLDEVNLLLRLVRPGAVAKRRAEALAEHTAVLDAIVAGDPEGAERAIREHLHRAEEFLRSEQEGPSGDELA